MSTATCAARPAYDAEVSAPDQLVAWAFLPPISLMSMVGESERRARFAYALQRALSARDISERQLAAKLRIDARHVARWRKGEALPDLYQTQEIVAYLRVSEELFRNPPAVPKPPRYPIEDYLLDAVDKGGKRGLDDPDPDDANDDGPDGRR